MPVRFYPEKPVDLLERYIVKDDGTPLQGEIDVYRMLYNDLSSSELDWMVWHDLKLPRHSDLVNHQGKTSAQLDFLILCHMGVMILEVKGGSISVSGNSFYYGKNLGTRLKEDPFRQAEGYKYTIKDQILNNLNTCFYCYAVAFPHVDYHFESRIFDDNLLWTKHKSNQFKGSIEEFIKSVFKYSKAVHKRFNRNYGSLERIEMDVIRKTLSPTIIDRNKFDSPNTLEWLQVNNLEILEGLYKNKRIMIEGPPGSGKTTIAKAFIERQNGKKGLYICWNNLLMHFTKQVLQQRTSVGDVEVISLMRLLKIMEPDLSTESMFKLGVDEFYEMVKKILKKAEQQEKLPSYDYIIIDEGQDVFDKGANLLMNKLCGYNKNGLVDGTILLLYDIDQSYMSGDRNVLEISDILSSYFSHFKLNEVKRSAQNQQIRQLSLSILQDPTILLQAGFPLLFPNITVQQHRSLEQAKRHLVQNVLSSIRSKDSSLTGKDVVVLIESGLLKGQYRDGPDMHYEMTMRDVEEFNENNVADTANKLRYTSILKFKGLERKHVFLLITEPRETNKYELYVGITRAIFNVEINIIH